MATYVNDLRLKEIATGDSSGSWGTETNTNLELIAEAMGHGSEAIANASTHTITMADGSTDEFRSTFLRLTGGGQACTVTLAPNTLSHTWIMRNETSAALTLSQGSGANVVIAAGQTKIVATDGAGSGAVVYEMDDLELANNLAVGGTLGVTGALTGSSTIQGTTITATTAFVPDASDGAALGTTSLEFSDIFLADGAVINLGDDQDTTLTHVADTGILLNSTRQLQFGDSGTYIHQSADGVLDLVSDTEIEINATTIDINGNADISGTIAAGGVVTANAGVVVDNITIDGTEIDLSSGDLTLDVASDIILDSDAGNWRFKDAGTAVLEIGRGGTGDGPSLFSAISDADMVFKGNDGGSAITALTLDMSAAGAATFNSTVTSTKFIADQFTSASGDVTFRRGGSSTARLLIENGTTTSGQNLAVTGTLTPSGVLTANAGVVVDNITIDGNEIDCGSGNLTLDSAGDIILDADGADITLSDAGTGFGNFKNSSSDFVIQSLVQDKDIKFLGNDNNSDVTALILDMSAAGAATFNAGATFSGIVTSSGANTSTNVTSSQTHGIALQNTSNTDGNFISVDFFNSTGFITGRIGAEFQDAGDRNTDLYFATRANSGSLTEQLRITSTGAATFNSGMVVNESGADADFRVESDDNTHMLFVDASVDRVGVGAAPMTNGSTFQVTSDSTESTNMQLTLRGASDTNKQMVMGFDTTANTAHVTTQIAGSAPTSLIFKTGDVVFNEASSDSDFRVESNDNTHMFFVDAGNNNVGIGTNAPSGSGLHVHDSTGGEQFISSSNSAMRFVSTGGVNFIQSGTATSSSSAADLIFTNVGGTGEVFRIAADGSLSTATSGTNNVRFGANAGNSIVSGGIRNTLIGDDAGTSITTGDSNVAVGFGALDAEDTGSSSTALGAFALSAQDTDTNAYNTAVGASAGLSITTGIKNILIGALSGDAITDADGNVAMGHSTLSSNVLGSYSVAVGFRALNNQNPASAADMYNTAVGTDAGVSVTTGIKNTIVGGLAGDAITTGNSNVAIGYEALSTEDGDDANVAVGFGALKTQNAGTTAYNTSVGYNAGTAITTGLVNTLIGGLAGDAITDADSNVAVGYASLSQNVLGSFSTAIGTGALAAQNPDSAANMYNVAVGAGAGNVVSTGTENTLVGGLSGDAVTDGGANVALGYAALGAEVRGNRAVALGHSALTTQSFNSSTANYNIGVGFHAGTSITTGINNVLVGGLAGDAITDADYNVGVGTGSLGTNVLGSRSTALGTNALFAQNPASAADMYNVAVGYEAGLSVTTGVQNTIVGAEAGDALTDADYNTAVGFRALGTDTLGNRSTALGYRALNTQNFDSATDTYNTAVGFQTGYSITTGTQNTFLGSLAGDATDDGAQNVAVGYLALSANCGDANTAVGRACLSQVTGGANTAMGQSAGGSVTSGGNNLLLGQDSGLTGSPGGAISTASNIIVLGDENISAANIQVSLTVASDERDKTDFADLALGLNFVKDLKPVTYKWDKRSKYGDKTADDYDLNAQTPDGTHKEPQLDVGFKAQEVEALEKAAGHKIADQTNLLTTLSGDGKQYGMQYEKFVPILVKAIQEQNSLIESLTARVKTLEGG